MIARRLALQELGPPTQKSAGSRSRWTIITTHVFEGTAHGPPNNPYLYGFGHNSQVEIFDKLIANNSQVFMVLSGHTSQETHQVKLNNAGLPVLQMSTDYNKWLGQGGDGFFRLMEIDEAANEVRVKTYSALLDQYRSTDNGQFAFPVDFATRFLPPTPPRSRLIGHWKLDDGATNPGAMTAADSSATGAHALWGAVESPRWTQRISAGAAMFGGSGTNVAVSPGIDDVISVENSTAVNLTGALTISAWVKYDAQMGGRPSTRHIAGKDRAGGPSGDAYSLKHDMTNNSDAVQFLVSSNGVNTNLSGSRSLSDFTNESLLGGWLLVTGVFQPGEFMRLYVNGVMDAELTGVDVPTSVDAIVATPFNIGRLHNSTSHSFTGAIDDVQLYDAALTSSQVAALYSHPGVPLSYFTNNPADFNADGSIDGADLARWQESFGGDAGADANGDARTDGADFLIWQRAFAQVSSPAAAIPEPASWRLSVLAFALALQCAQEGLDEPRRELGLGRSPTPPQRPVSSLLESTATSTKTGGSSEPPSTLPARLPLGRASRARTAIRQRKSHSYLAISLVIVCASRDAQGGRWCALV